MSHSQNDLALPVILLLGGVYLYIDGWRRLRRRWLIDNLPSSRVRSVAMGLAELSGMARAVGNPFLSPVRRMSCVWAHTRVIRRTGSGKNEHDTVVFDRHTGVPFELEDATGRILVLPEGAEMEGVEICDAWVQRGVDGPADVGIFCQANGLGVSGWFDGSLRVTETAVLTDTEVFVIGDVGRLNDPAADRARRVSEVLKGWLGSAPSKATIDANHDGIIDQEEWEAARARAQSDVLAAEGPPQGPQVAVRKPPSGLFLISPGSRKDALQALGHPGWRLAVGIGLVVVAWWAFPFDRYHEFGAPQIFGGVVVVAQAAGLWSWIRMRA